MNTPQWCVIYLFNSLMTQQHLLKNVNIMPCEMQHTHLCHNQRELRHVSWNVIIIVTNV